MKTIMLLIIFFIFLCPVFGQDTDLGFEANNDTLYYTPQKDSSYYGLVLIGASIHTIKYDTLAIELVVATDSVYLTKNSYYRFPTRVLTVIDGWGILKDGWFLGDYLGEDKKPLKQKVYMSFPKGE